jgi:hypothetical protein
LTGHGRACGDASSGKKSTAVEKGDWYGLTTGGWLLGRQVRRRQENGERGVCKAFPGSVVRKMREGAGELLRFRGVVEGTRYSKAEMGEERRHTRTCSV